jgi:NarL family two-component system response regulator LiaR
VTERTDATAPSTIRILIVDDHAVVRQGLRTFLELQDDATGQQSDFGGRPYEPSHLPIQVVGEAADGAEAVELAARFQPDVILLDLVMPVMDGIAATRKIVERCPHSRIIILTSFGEEDRVFPAIRAGAHGYLLKDIKPDDLVQAIRAAYLGRVQLHPEVAQKLMAAVAESTLPSGGGSPARQAASAPAVRSRNPDANALTERERDVLRLLAAGLSNREIAGELVIGETTVKSHVSSILNKLHLADRTQAAIYALRHDLAGDGP